MSNPILIAGAPGSPYTRKMLGVMRYRRIPYRFVSDTATWDALPQAKMRLFPTFYFPDADGEPVPMLDSTPIIRRLDLEHPARRLAPASAALAFVDALLEDYADEWLTKAMFHYRWSYGPDIRKSAAVLPIWFEPPMDSQTLQTKGAAFARRQIGRLGYVGSNPVTAPLIEASFRRLLAILQSHLAEHAFLLGDRPTAADFAFHGQLTQLALFDPTPMAIVTAEAPRVIAWTIGMEDLSGHEEGRLHPVHALPDTVHALLREVGGTYAPLLLANARAFADGAATLDMTLDGQPWRQPVFAYHLRCLAALRAQNAALNRPDRDAVDAVLRGTGCDALFAVS